MVYTNIEIEKGNIFKKEYMVSLQLQELISFLCDILLKKCVRNSIVDLYSVIATHSLNVNVNQS